MPDVNVLACARVKDLEEPKTDARIQGCDECGTLIWVADDYPADTDRFLCIECLKIMLTGVLRTH